MKKVNKKKMDRDISVYGVVVVGLGRAGNVRIRDLTAATEHNGACWTVKGFVSRRDIAIEGVDRLTMEEMLEREDIHIVIVCTENCTHEDITRRCLEKGKHVLVEFPLACSWSAANELLQLAASKGLILHEENIGLLNDFKDTLQAAGQWKHITIALEASFDTCSWISDIKKAGPPFIASISLIQTAVELCNTDLNVVDGQISVDSGQGFTARADLQTKDGRTLEIKVSRRKDNARRQKTVRADMEDGTQVEYTPNKPNTDSQSKKVGLFMRDFLIFIDKVTSGKNSDKDIDRTLCSLKLADSIHGKMTLPQSYNV